MRETPEQEEERLVREIARDPNASPAQRLRALEVLERKRAHRAQRPVGDEVAPDPLETVDELEQRRRRRRSA